MSQAISKFVADLALHFPNRFDSEQSEDEWLKSMFRNLSGYKAEVLDAAAQYLIDNRTDRRFPLPADCRKACNEASRRLQSERPTLQTETEPKFGEFSDARIKLADDLVARSSIAKEAARDGWVLVLHDFCREHGMLPVGSQITDCKAAAKRFERTYELCIRGEAGFANQSLLALAEGMIARREELAARVLGRAA